MTKKQEFYCAIGWLIVGLLAFLIFISGALAADSKRTDFYDQYGFHKGYSVTQPYGNRTDFYDQYGLPKGHSTETPRGFNQGNWRGYRVAPKGFGREVR